MGKIESYRDIIAWQRARELTRSLYAVTSREPLARDRALVDQIRRAAVSVMSNVAEGFGRGTNADFARFLDMAMGSANEVGSLLTVIEDVYPGIFKSSDVQTVTALLDETLLITRGLRSSIRPRLHEEKLLYQESTTATTQDSRLKTQDSYFTQD